MANNLNGLRLIQCVDHRFEPRGADVARIQRVRDNWELHYGLGSMDRPNKARFCRSGISIGGRDVAYVRDILDHGALIADNPFDILLLMNNDSFLPIDFTDYLPNNGSWCSYRLDHSRPLKGRIPVSWHLASGMGSNGVDMVGITVSDWLKIRLEIPDLFLGCQGWDWVMRTVLPALQYPIVAHELHGIPFWADHRDTDICNLENRRLCRQWVDNRGDAAYVRANWPGIECY